MGPGLLATSALPLALIHRVADQEGSRILLFTLSGAYALGPVPRGGFLARGEISTSHLATRLDGYSLEEPTPPAPLLLHRQGSMLPTILFSETRHSERDACFLTTSQTVAGVKVLLYRRHLLCRYPLMIEAAR
jgi:crotonobetainyl-CoA:carnitine CoA-transferase CaiB-like acyl-CoA transferase